MGLESSRARGIPETEVTNRQAKEGSHQDEAVRPLKEKEVKQRLQNCGRQNSTSHEWEENTGTCPTAPRVSAGRLRRRFCPIVGV